MSYFLRNFPSPFESTPSASTSRNLLNEQQLFQNIRSRYVQLLLEASRKHFGREAILHLAGDGEDIGEFEDEKGSRKATKRHCDSGK